MIDNSILSKATGVIHLHADGACRNNGKPDAIASCAVFCLSYECSWSRGRILDETTTNNGAETTNRYLPYLIWNTHNIC